MICIEFAKCSFSCIFIPIIYIYIYILHFSYGGCYEIYMGEKYARAKVAQKEEKEKKKEEENRERDINRGEIKIKIHRVSFDNSKIDLILIRKT